MLWSTLQKHAKLIAETHTNNNICCESFSVWRQIALLSDVGSMKMLYTDMLFNYDFLQSRAKLYAPKFTATHLALSHKSLESIVQTAQQGGDHHRARAPNTRSLFAFVPFFLLELLRACAVDTTMHTHVRMKLKSRGRAWILAARIGIQTRTAEETTSVYYINIIQDKRWFRRCTPCCFEVYAVSRCWRCLCVHVCASYYNYKLSVLICVRNYLVYALENAFKFVRWTNACGFTVSTHGRRRLFLICSRARDFVSMICGRGFDTCCFGFQCFSGRKEPSNDYMCFVCVVCESRDVWCLNFWTERLMNAGWFLFFVCVCCACCDLAKNDWERRCGEVVEIAPHGILLNDAYKTQTRKSIYQSGRFCVFDVFVLLLYGCVCVCRILVLLRTFSVATFFLVVVVVGKRVRRRWWSWCWCWGQTRTNMLIALTDHMQK